MKPWTVIVRSSLVGPTHAYVRETSLPHDRDTAWAVACERYGNQHVVAILPGSFKNIVFNGFSETNR